MKHLASLLLILFPLTCLADTTSVKPLITQTITYQTSKASETYLVWSLSNWKETPPKQFWPKNTFLKDGKAWSRMEGNRDSFSITITLPVNTNLVFIFWVPLDNKGNSTNGWDTNEDLTYFSDFRQNSHLRLTDWGLVMPSFDILKSGWYFLFGSLFISGIVIVVFRRRLSFSGVGLLTGLVSASIIIIAIIRTQMNRLRTTAHHIFGAIFYDVLWLFIISAFFTLLIYLFRKHAAARRLIVFVFGALLLGSLLFSLCNIEIVRILKRPVNYQWLYYADFLNGADAKNAIANNLSGQLILNIVLLLLSVLIFAIPFSLLPAQLIKKLHSLVAITFILILLIGFFQSKTVQYAKGQIENPFFEIITSSVISEKSSKLFSLKISEKTRSFIQRYHSLDYKNKYDSNGIIKNIILFVLESTPHRYVSLYDSTYNATPNLKKWKAISSVYTRMYAHMPATVYSMSSINSGVYPLISHISLIANYPNNTIPSISAELAKNNWNTALLFSADLKYSNINIYAHQQQFKLAEDNTSMPCKFEKFGTSNTFIDPLDDKCLVNRYFEWIDSVKSEKKFGVLWTNQTHYPYNFTGREVMYNEENKDLNHYLNALRNADEAFGNLMEGLKSRGLLDNTVVIVTADHGEAFGSHDQIIHASKIYEENVHIPFIMYNPVFFNGSTNNDVWGLIDIPPTITHLTGIKKPVEWQGKSMLSAIKGERTFYINPFSDFLFGTLHNNWKYIYNATTNKDELYDLQNDKNELNNVAKTHPEIVKTEFEMLAGWVQYHRTRMEKMGIR